MDNNTIFRVGHVKTQIHNEKNRNPWNTKGIDLQSKPRNLKGTKINYKR